MSSLINYRRKTLKDIFGLSSASSLPLSLSVSKSITKTSGGATVDVNEQTEKRKTIFIYKMDLKVHGFNTELIKILCMIIC